VLLGVIHEDIADAERTQAEEREPAMLARAKAQAKLAQKTPGEDEERGEQEPVGHAHLGRNRPELKGDRQPGRAPDRDANREILKIDYARSMYLPSAVSILIFSPLLMKGGTCTVMPVSILAGLKELVAVEFLIPGSVSSTVRTTEGGSSTPMARPL